MLETVRHLSRHTGAPSAPKRRTQRFCVCIPWRRRSRNWIRRQSLDADEDELNNNLLEFLAENQISRLSMEVDATFKEQRLRKRANKDISLHSHAVQYFHENKGDFQALAELLEMAAKEKLDDDSLVEFRTQVNKLYSDLIKGFAGTIVTTPVAASTHHFRTLFAPDVVITDEAEPLRELSSLVFQIFLRPESVAFCW
ncbi:hypothetical protein SPI_04136 [Niveomyces insectorum RCEF 264]|uniref:Uncharacterized protein n=1 Tax=Niveomyces insectorum RCEF 264 TaxID=1081102 RepID=A0A167VGS2_9HYPO|nr:hypothetical protein SPI_04136 [Niveomyces insectorum RCEF 264]